MWLDPKPFTACRWYAPTNAKPNVNTIIHHLPTFNRKADKHRVDKQSCGMGIVPVEADGREDIIDLSPNDDWDDMPREEGKRLVAVLWHLIQVASRCSTRDIPF